jgi:hypothetical protein
VAYVLSLLEGYGDDEAEAMDTELVGETSTSPGWIEKGSPPDRSEARRIAKMAKSFTHIDGELYKRATSGVLQ